MESSGIFLCGTVRSNEDHEVNIDTFDLDLPPIKEKGARLDEIKRYVLQENFNVYPHQNIRAADETKTILCHRLQSLSRKGLAYIADNLAVSASISKPTPEHQPEDVILDVCLLVQGLPPAVFTLVKDNPVSLDMVKSYNLTLVQGVIKEVRRLTTEQFSAVYGLIQMCNLNTQDDFERRLAALKDETSWMCVLDSLKMPEGKCTKVIKAFLSSIAMTSCVVNDDNSDTLWFLTLEQFCILTENIDQRQVTVITAPSSGGKVLMREITKRLDISGPTLLVMKTDEEIQVARNQKSGFLMLTLEEWKDRLVKGEATDGIINLVTNCQDCPAVPGLKGRCWTFLPGLHSFTVTANQDEQQHVLRDDKGISATSSSTTSQILHDVLGKNRRLETEIEEQNSKIKGLMEENATLRLTEEELSRMLDSVTLSGLSLDSGQGSDVSSLASWRITRSVGPQGATGGQKEAKGILKSIKKRLTLGGSKSKALKEVPVYLYVIHNEDRTHSITVACRQHEMDRQRVNTTKCHVTEDGQLLNSPITGRVQQGNRRFKTYWGTCSTSPIHLPASPFSPTLVPPSPQYWETETAVGVKEIPEWLWRTVLEIGVVEEDQLDSDVLVYGSPRSWCVKVGWCHTHKNYCTQVWNQKEHVTCGRYTLSDTPGASQILRYGVVIDTVRGRLGFVDVERAAVLEKMDVEFRQTVYPMFSIYPYSNLVTVKIRLVSGTDIQMTDDKQKLIYSCLV